MNNNGALTRQHNKFVGAWVWTETKKMGAISLNFPSKNIKKKQQTKTDFSKENGFFIEELCTGTL